MIKLKFYLRKEIKTKDGLHPVYMDISYNGNRIRKPVQHLKVKGNHWLLKQQRIRKPSKEESYNFFEEYNLKLDELANTIGEIKKSVLIHNHQLSDRFILDRLENPNKIQVDKRQFFAIVKEYLEQSRSIKSKNTLKGAVSTFNFLEKFQSEKNHKLNLQEINQQFFEKLRRYAFEEKNIGDNYFAKIIASLKTFLSWSLELGYHSNTSYKKFKAVERETEVIYLTMEELFHLYRFPLPSRKLSHVRDFYCFGCFTGLRFSDLITLRSIHIRGDYIVKTIQKTQELESRIPLSKFAKEILSKYKETVYEPLPKVSHQKFNDYIKECCKLAGIDSPLTIVRFSGANRVESVHPKWQLITSHTARKTFVTNSLILGMKEVVVKNISGHKKEKSFSRYVKIADNIKQNEIEKTWDSFIASTNT